MPYKIIFLAPNKENKINIPSILAIPLLDNINNQIMLEANNLESENLEDILEQGINTGLRLTLLTKDCPCPVVIPLIPSLSDYPYLQQLSRECFDLPSNDKYSRMDDQIVRIISVAKRVIEKEKEIDMSEKIILNGYSSSGVFAQRFCLSHPDIIDTVCIGGASGSIPLPSDKLA